MSVDYVLTDDRPRRLSQDQRAELSLGALSCFVGFLVYAMLLFIFIKAWPSFSHNGLDWFIGGGSVDKQLHDMFDSSNLANGSEVYTFHAWPLILGTLLIVGISVIISIFISLMAAVFMVEFAPEPIKKLLVPIVRLLASVPSVIFGLLGVLVLVPLIGNHFITRDQQESVRYIVSLNGYSLLAAVIVLTVMIAPIMVAMFADGLRTVPRLWTEGSLALGINRWRTFWKIAVRGARPAIISGTVLATARGIGEAIAVAMVAGGTTFVPNPADGAIFMFEPARPITAAILFNVENLSSKPIGATLFALAFVLLLATMVLSLSGWAAKQPMKKYGVRS
jgi:phosphate ABC transporter permease protein PstC